MGRGGNKADIAVTFTAGRVIFRNGQQTGIFALRAGIGLH